MEPKRCVYMDKLAITLYTRPLKKLFAQLDNSLRGWETGVFRKVHRKIKYMCI